MNSRRDRRREPVQSQTGMT